MKRALLAAVAGAAVATAIAGGIAWATIPAANGTIRACYQQNGGQLRVIDAGAGETCRSSEIPISWNQNGPQGTTGPRGPQGPTGPRGAQGPTGSQGIQGVRGTTGSTGATGSQGRAGQDGAKGDRGATGATGDRGPMGVPGPTGPSGAEPVTPPDPWEFRDSALNQLSSNFSLELPAEGVTVRVTSFAGCAPTTFGGKPGNCYFTIRGFPNALDDWVNDTLSGHPDAVQDLVVRGPLSTTGAGTPDVQFKLDDAFITSASIDLDAQAGNTAGTVDLVVAANGFVSQTPTSAPGCQCSSSSGGLFNANAFSLQVQGQSRAATTVQGLGFTVPRLGTSTYFPGSPQFNAIRVGVGVGGNQSAATRTYFQNWSNSVASGNVDLRDGRVTLLNAAFDPIEEIDLEDLEPVAPFGPLFRNDVETFTLLPGVMDYH